MAHTACTVTTGPVLINQLPASGELAVQALEPPADLAPIEPPPVEFSTATYDRAKHSPTRRR
jgi:hypothetical protein